MPACGIVAQSHCWPHGADGKGARQHENCWWVTPSRMHGHADACDRAVAARQPSSWTCTFGEGPATAHAGNHTAPRHSCTAHRSGTGHGSANLHLNGEAVLLGEGQGQVLEGLEVVAGGPAAAAGQAALQLALKQVADDAALLRPGRTPGLLCLPQVPRLGHWEMYRR